MERSFNWTSEFVNIRTCSLRCELCWCILLFICVASRVKWDSDRRSGGGRLDNFSDWAEEGIHRDV